MSDTSQKKHAKSAKKRRKVKLAVFAAEIIVLLVVLGVLFVALKLSKLDSGNKIEAKDLQMNDLPKETKTTLEKYTTIALFGLDNRDTGDFIRGNSDVIIIASINEKTKEVKMASVYRDTYLNMTDTSLGYRKANAAYANGGVDLAVSMLNVNLDLDITDYVVVDFNAVTKAIDLLGGIEVTLTDEEARLINGYIEEVEEVTGTKSQRIYSGGTYTLDGVQATSYARIRYTMGDDYKRTERQRYVIGKMVEKALASDLATINELVDAVLPEIKTSFTTSELLLLAKDAFDYSLGENTGFPFEQLATDLGGKAGDCVIPLDLAGNVEKLHEFLFETENYQVTPSVSRISSEIVQKTGLSAADIP